MSGEIRTIFRQGESGARDADCRRIMGRELAWCLAVKFAALILLWLTRFSDMLFGINFATGVATGITMQPGRHLRPPSHWLDGECRL